MPLYKISHYLDLRRLEVGQNYEVGPYKWVKIIQHVGRNLEKQNIYKVIEARDPSDLPTIIPE